MKKSLKMAALAGILGLTAWLGSGPGASAVVYPPCSSFYGKVCYNEGATLTCQYQGTPFTGTCECTGGRWFCVGG